MSDESCYWEAKEQLDDMFGGPGRLEQAHRRKLEEWENYEGNGEDFGKVKKIYFFLDKCKRLKDGYLNVAMRYWDSVRFIENCVLTKLPKRIGPQWRRRITQYANNTEYFSVLVNFLRERISHYEEWDHYYYQQTLYEKHGGDSYYPEEFQDIPALPDDI